jgi:hypothetical protein
LQRNSKHTLYQYVPISPLLKTQLFMR